MRKCYITTPIYYASGRVHIGNSYTTVVCDVLARFNRAKGRETFYLTGMDEHGQKIQEAAEKQGITPQELVDKIADTTKTTWEALDINYDYFIRTTDQNHVKAVQKVFEKLLAKGDIYLGSYQGNYCVSCEAYFTKTQLGENDTCPDCGKPTKLVTEESYFLNLKKYQNRLLEYIKNHPDFIQPETRRNEVVSFIEAGLEDLCVSRTSFDWGIKVPSNPRHVVYVWIDALMNYLSALGYDTDDDSLYQKFWINSPDIYQVIAKDILRFHAIYWPILLMALDVPLNGKLYVHGWILNRDGKMSKSRGGVIYPMDLTSVYGVDAVRYYLTKELPLGNDGLFSYERFIERYNNELANDLGNLLNRTVAMIEKYFDGIIPNIQAPLSNFDKDLSSVIQNAIASSADLMDQFELQAAYNEIWKIVRAANKYIDDTMPWSLAKNESDKPMLANVMYHLAEALRIVANLVSPCLVESAPKMLLALGLEGTIPSLVDLAFGYQYVNVKVQKTEPLFKRLDPEVELARFNKKEEKPQEVKKQEEKIAEITIDDFAKVSLKVGEIVASKRHENAERLLVSQVKINGEVRQIVSGIAKYYDPATPVGRKVIVVTNLKPVKIRGAESNGMILCAVDGDDLELIEIKDLPNGATVR